MFDNVGDDDAYQSESLVLRIPVCHKLGFKFFYAAICSIFDLVDPS